MADSVEVTIRGEEVLKRVATDLRQFGDKDLKKQTYRALQRAGKKLKPKVDTAAARLMPSGYAPEFVSSLKVTGSVTMGRKSANLRVVARAKGAKEKRDVAARDRGSLRHPVFGRYRFVQVAGDGGTFDVRRIENPWVNQRIRPGFFSDTITENLDEVRDDIAAGLSSAVDDLMRG